MGSAASLGYRSDVELLTDLEAEYKKAVADGAGDEEACRRLQTRVKGRYAASPGGEPEGKAQDEPSDREADGERQRSAPIFSKGLRDVAATLSDATEAKSAAAIEIITAALKHTLFDPSEDSLIGETKVIDAMHRLHAAAGTDVIVEGDAGEHFFVIESGDLDVLVEDVCVNQLHSGEYFGELALIYNAPRAATVRAATDCVLWTLDRTKFREIQARASVNSLVQRCRWLTDVPLLSTLSRRQLAILANALEPCTFEDGEFVIEQGTPGDAFYVIESGTVAISMAASLRQAFKNLTNRLRALTTFGNTAGSSSGDRVTMAQAMHLIEPGSLRPAQQVARLGEGSYFGEAALLTNQPRNASVKAVGHVKLLRLGREAFQELLGPLGDLLEMNSNTRYLRTVAEFADMDERSLQDVVSQMELVDHEPNDVIMETTGKAKGLYLVKSGSVAVNDGTADEYVLQSGAHFGECALQNRPSRITVTSISKSHFLMLPARESVAVRRATTRRQTTIQARKSVVDNVQRHLVGLELNELPEMGVLGEGSFGRVTLVQVSDAPLVLALKTMSKAHIVSHGQEVHIMGERKVLKEMIPHPFVTQLYATSQDEDCLYMLCELVQGGELFSVIHTQGCRDMRSARFYCANVFLALEHLHKQDIAYRDLKPENLLVAANGYVKVIDLGFAKQIPYTETLGGGGEEVHTKSYTLCGTPEYLAPEFILNIGHDHSVDLWALGILTYEILFGRTPFETHDRDYAEMFKNIAMVRTTGSTPPFPAEFFEEGGDDALHAAEVITQLLHGNPDMRLGARKGGGREVREHPWFAELSWEEMLDQEVDPPYVPVVSGPFDVSNFSSGVSGDPPEIEPYDGDFVFAGF